MAKKVSLPFRGDLQHSQGFGARPDVYSKFGLNGHDGDDWVAPIGTPVFAPVSGDVIRVGYDNNGWGMFFTVSDMTQKIAVTVGHLSNVFVQKGDKVNAGTKIAESGNTGFSEAPHIHAHANDVDDAGIILTPSDGFKGRYSILDSSRIELVPLPAEGAVGQAAPPPAAIAPVGGPQGIKKGSYPPESLTQEARQWLWEQFGHDGSAPVGYGGESGGDVPGKVSGGLPTGPGGIKPGDYRADQLSQDQRNFLWHFFGNSGDAPVGFGGYRYFGQTGPWPDNAKYGPGGIPPGSYDPTSLKQEQRQWLYEYFGHEGIAPVGYGGEWISAINPGGPARPITTPPTPPSVPEPTPIPPAAVSLYNKPTMEPTIAVRSIPDRAKFYIDGLYFADLTPANKPYPVTVGSHEVVIEKTGYERYTETVNVAEGEQKVVEGTLTKTPAIGLPVLGVVPPPTQAPTSTTPTTAPTTKELVIQILAEVKKISAVVLQKQPETAV